MREHERMRTARAQVEQARQEIQEQHAQAQATKARLNRQALDRQDASDDLRDAHADAEEASQELGFAEEHMADLIYEIENELRYRWASQCAR